MTKKPSIDAIEIVNSNIVGNLLIKYKNSAAMP